MKRLLVIILSLLYMASATGATIHIHSCMGKLMSAGLVEKQGEGCEECCTKDGDSRDCCKDEQKTVKVGDHHVTKETLKVLQSVGVAQPPYIYGRIASFVFYRAERSVSLAHAPPSSWRTCPIYKEIKNFRI
jgi:hypothetical protein